MAEFNLGTKFSADKLSDRKQHAYNELKKNASFLADYDPTSRQSDFEKYGFPEKMLDCFMSTAEITNSVVSTRVPGLATTQLIEDGYDMKGYFIKSKSCDWGPMSGFLCRHPAFNKKGKAGIEFNSKNIWYCKKYYTTFYNVQESDFTSRAFVPIKISEAQKNKILSELLFTDEVNKDKIYGLAIDAKTANKSQASIIMEFVLIKDTTTKLWSVYYGKVYEKKESTSANPDSGFREYSAENYKNIKVKDNNKNEIEIGLQFLQTLAGGNAVNGVEIGRAALVKIKNYLLDNFNITRDLSVDQWRTVDGIANPDPAYGTDRDSSLFYKNAVTGDYDLFAVWPYIPAGGFQDLVRVTESAPANSALLARDREYVEFGKLPLSQRRYLIPVPGKSMALELTRSRDVYMEFIPDLKSIDELENNRMGNVNEAVTIAAGMLNSLAKSAYDQPPAQGGNPGPNYRYSRNVAFHSDEGGRPGVNDIEYPVAFFLPPDFAQWCGLNQALLIQSHVQFLALVNFLQGQYFVPLNWGWFIHFFAVVQQESDLTAAINSLKAENQKDAQQYCTARRSEMQKLKAGEQDNIIQYLKYLLVTEAHTRDEPTDAEKAIDNAVFKALAAKFLTVMKNEVPAGNESVYLKWKAAFENLSVSPPATTTTTTTTT